MEDIIVESSCADLSIEKKRLSNGFSKKLENNGLLVFVDEFNDSYEIIIYSISKSTLSDYMPVLQSFGFNVDSEFSYVVKKDGLEIFGRKYYISPDLNKYLGKSKKNVQELLEKVLKKEALNTNLNALSVKGNLSAKDIGLLSAFLTYENQLLAEQSEQSLNATLVNYYEYAKAFVEYFKLKFKADVKNRKEALKKQEDVLSRHIKVVKDITDDKTLNVLKDILMATIRTNFFEKENIFTDNALALKVRVKDLSVHLKGIQPRYETFVYHNSFVGTHLRRTKVSRGGLRWSDRELDYRNEIKSLMQAQRSKNSVIIPSGSKGGFFITEKNISKERYKEIYESFISALLDVVDNYKDGEVVSGNQVVYDSPDPYFVVAADKGTSAMSDVANAISIKRGYWLGDAFASGGSNGFNHKDMGITAKGSIKSTERFFIEKGINIYEESIKVVGIGSPAGDVFGNGIQLSRKFALVGAVSSREIFIDPTPDVEKAYSERQRLFDNALGWGDYNRDLISEGGGIFKKSDKTISVTKEMKDLFSIKKDIVNGEELTRAVISAKVDLLFNGGVGTYVRGNDESDSSIGDKPNESVRVNASDIKAYAVCEGGNLGLTQKARVDYAKKGGRISADSIDNSAGVHTSDYEVNIKIILNYLVEKNVISEENRLEVLHSLEDDVERVTLWTNYFQSLALSLDEIRSMKDIDSFKKTISVLADEVENFTPSDYEIPAVSELHTVMNKNGTLYRPLLAVLLSFSKIFLQSIIMKDKEFLETETAHEYLFKYFPKSFDTLYSKEVAKHPLRKEIIATTIANLIINHQGSTFIEDYQELGNEKFMLKVKSFLTLNEVISGNDVRYKIYREDYSMAIKKQYEMLLELEDSVKFLIEWILEHGKDATLIFDRTHEYKVAFDKFLKASSPNMAKRCDVTEINCFFSMIEYVRMLTTIIQVKEDTKQDLVDVANLFLRTTQELGILELNEQIKALECSNFWEERLKDRLIKQTLEIVSTLIDKIMHFKRQNEDIEVAFKSFADIHKGGYDRYLKDYKAIKSSGNINFTNLTVVIGTLSQITDGTN